LSSCPCGSGRALEICCGAYLAGKTVADAETLMRSRYAAYVLGKYDYLLVSWHPLTRPARLGGTALRWIGLEILRTVAGGVQDDVGEVEFIASYVEKGKGKRLHELSRFVCEEGRWLYMDGDCQVDDIGRNNACPCGSGKKFKRCCGQKI